MLTVERLHLQIGAFRLSDVSLAVDEGEYFVLMGPTGSGKSLLARSITGLIPVESGRVAIGGRDVTGCEPRDRGIGYLPQQGDLFPHLDVAGNITFAQRVRGRSRGKALSAVEPLVAMLGLGTLMSRHVDTLSGGERQKVALARALAAEPRLLVLDEPLSALDEPARREIAGELRDVQRTLGIATVHICHSTEEAESLGDRVGVMHGGRLVQAATLEELRRRPADETVARMVAKRGL
jgi:ABC-type sugar transport system ATPase subunit